MIKKKLNAHEQCSLIHDCYYCNTYIKSSIIIDKYVTVLAYTYMMNKCNINNGNVLKK